MSLFSRINAPRLSGASNNTNAGVCKFYTEGRCRYGEQCRFYHPPRDATTPSSNSKQSAPYHLTADGVKADMTQGDDRPQWPLSAYGPGRDAPRQLLEAPLEQSPEELRVQYYLAKDGGSTQQYEQNERSAVDQANQRAEQILNDIDGALKYIIDGKDQHPNRDDQTQKNAGNFNWGTRPSFNQTAAPSSSGTAFGQSSTVGASSPSAFGKPSPPGFGQSSTLGSSTPFSGNTAGGTTAFGSGQMSSTSAFGRPSALGGGGSTAFGQPSNLGGGSTAFGKPSGLGGTPAFGSPSTSNSTPFGQAPSNTRASPFGQSSNNTGGPAFGQASNPGGSTAFGQPSAPGSSTAFGKPSSFGAAASGTPAFGGSTPFGAQATSNTSAFGQPSQPSQRSSPFAQPSQPSQPVQQSSPFGQAAQPAPPQSTFGKPAAFGSSGGTASTFGQPAFGSSTTFGAASSTPAFGKPSAPSQQQSTFGSGATTNGPTGAFGSHAQPNNAPFARQTSAAPGQRITAFKGRPVTYQRLEKKAEDKKEYPFYHNPSTNKLERIWLPDGHPGPNLDVEAPPQTYEALGAALKQLYDFVLESGTFKDGLVPEVPPKREWVNWEL